MRLIAAALLLVAAAPVSVDLPGDLAPYPDLPGGPSAEAINANCLGCHSADMAMTQPRLTPTEWAGEVAKMRNVFKAPIDAADDAAITAWLVEWSRRLPAAPVAHKPAAPVAHKPAAPVAHKPAARPTTKPAG